MEDREVLHTKVRCEVDVGSQVADLVCPSSFGQPPVSKGTALQPKTPPSGTMSQAWKKQQLIFMIKIKLIIINIF